MRTILLLALCGILLASCKKKDECANYQAPVDIVQDAALNTWQFQPGTYWVYKNAQTSVLDSQAVMSSVDNSFTGEYPSKCSGGTHVQENRINVKSFLSNAYYDYFLINSAVYKDLTATGTHHGRIIYNAAGVYEDDAELVEVLPLLTFNGHTFTNVTKVQIHALPSGSFEPNLSAHELYLYFADSIGLIKWEEDFGNGTSDTWELQSWDIQL